MKPIFFQNNFREYLREWFSLVQKKNPKFSLRAMSQKADINSSAFFKYILDGSRNLGPKTLPKVIKLLKLSNQEAQYFEYLVTFNQEKRNSKKEEAFQKMVAIREAYKRKDVDSQKWDFYEKWYHSAIRELACMLPPPVTYKSIGPWLYPEVKPVEVMKSLEFLVENEFLIENQDHSFQQSNSIITTTGAKAQEVLKNFQKTMINLALHAMDEAPQGKKLNSSTTLAINEKDFEFACERIRAIRKELLERARIQNQPDRVYQLNFQLFPLSQL